MPISAAQSDAPEPDPRRKGRVELLAADPTSEANESIRQLTGDQSTATEDDIPDSPMEATAIGANGSLGDAESDLPTSEVGLPVPVPTNGDVFALDELLEDFPEPPADVMRQAADPSLSYDGLGLDGSTAADQLVHDDRAAPRNRGGARRDPGSGSRQRQPRRPGQDVSAGDRPGLAPDR